MTVGVKITDMFTLNTPSLETLGAEPVPGEIVRDLLKQAWLDTQRCKRPEIHLMNDLTLPAEQMHLKKADYILLAEPNVQESQHGHSYEYKDIEITVQMELYTIANRQRLYDLWAEVKRIVYTYQNVVRPYQQLHVDNFTESVRDKHGFWAGTAQIRLESKAVPVISGISTGFETPAQPQASTHAAAHRQIPASGLEQPGTPPLPTENDDPSTF